MKPDADIDPALWVCGCIRLQAALWVCVCKRLQLPAALWVCVCIRLQLPAALCVCVCIRLQLPADHFRWLCIFTELLGGPPLPLSTDTSICPHHCLTPPHHPDRNIPRTLILKR